MKFKINIEYQKTSGIIKKRNICQTETNLSSLIYWSTKARADNTMASVAQ